jgi:hypothetical protein
MYEAWNLREVQECLELGIDVTPLPFLYTITAGQLSQVSSTSSFLYFKNLSTFVPILFHTYIDNLVQACFTPNPESIE